MAAQHLLRLTNVTRRVRDRTGALLDSVSLTIDAGERIGLVGPSGSGKSSLLRAMARLDRWEQGEVEFCGKLVARDAIPGFRRRVIYLPQRPSLWPGTVRMNLQAPFAFASSQSQYDESAATRWLEAFDKPSALLDQSADSLSGGEQQIVALIRAILLDPILLLLDEPSASLDPEATRRMEGLVLAWQQAGSPLSEPSVSKPSVPNQSGSEPERSGPAERSGPEHARALVWTSHNADQINRVATRVVQIDHGELRQEGEA